MKLRNRYKFFGSLLLASTLLIATTNASSYNLPSANEKAILDDNVLALQKISKGVSAIAKNAEKAVVFVSVYKTSRGLPPGMIDPFEFFFGPQQGGPRGRGNQREQKREEGLGSGFFIDLNQGFIMTNNHVIQDADEIQLKLANGDTHEGKIIGRDPNTDVAIVQVKEKNFNKTGLSQLVLSNSDDSEVGDFVVAVGAPYGLEASVSFGIISALGRGSLDITAMGNFIQTDAAINPGNSGGPLLDTSGQVLGMNTAIYSKTGGYNGIGFAVPSNLAKRIAEQLINKGKVSRGYIGVGLQPIDGELHKSLGLPKDTNGILISKIVEGGPADKGGLEPGDVIVSINKTAMKKDSDATNVIGLMSPGANADIGVYRNGKLRTQTVKIGEFPNENQLASASEKSGGELAFGLTLQKLNPSLREQYNLDSKNGVVIVGVAKGSEGERVDLQAGDLILQVNGKPVNDADTFQKLAKSSGQRALLRIERRGQYFFVPLRNK
ncbi:MAG: Do family serine endopeptidase [Proteobacteria bacterium]|nr:Do family serine endopeptidase [Pseudomonadota bacterium]